MTKYLLKRLLHGLFSIVVVVAIVMILIYSLMDRTFIFSADSVYSHMANNQKEVYKYRKWEEYGYLDYVPYADYLIELYDNGEISAETREEAANFGRTAHNDSEIVREYVAKFTDHYESKGYTVVRMDAKLVGGKSLPPAASSSFSHTRIFRFPTVC